LSVVVERAKKCLDFTVTLYFLHLMFCWAYRGASHMSVIWSALLGQSMHVPSGASLHSPFDCRLATQF
jgi:hypothetical protein